jgi:two-component system, NtrC family, sensor kinase
VSDRMLGKQNDVRLSTEMIERLIGPRDPKSLLLQAALLVLAECNADAVALAMGPSQGQLELAARVRSSQASADVTGKLALILADQASHQASPLLFEVDGSSLSDAPRRMLRSEGFRTAIAVPIQSQPGAVGALTIFWRRAEPIDQTMLERAAAIAGIIATATARARDYQRISEERSRLSAVVSAVAYPLIVFESGSLVIAMVNHATEELIGAGAVELIGQLVSSVITVSSPEGFSFSQARSGMQLEGRLIRRAGAPLPIALQAGESPEAPRLITLTIQDLSEQWRPLQQMMLAEKLAGMSRLTAMIAHQINNPLQAITNTLRLLSRPLEQEKRDRYLSLAQTEIERLTGLVRRMLDIYQVTRVSYRPVAIHTQLESAIAQISASVDREQLVIERDLAPGNPRVMGSGIHLREVFVSLIQNAVEAMPAGGRLVVRTRIEAIAGAQGGVVMVEVSDTGAGISEENLEQIFEPFATTKDGAVGMGLAISYSIVEHHAGRLSVHSGPGETVFRATLPLASHSE